MSATPLRVQVAELARRSIVQTLRQPLLIVPPILFPLVLVAVNASGLQAATRIPGSRPTTTSTSRSPWPSSRVRCSR